MDKARVVEQLRASVRADLEALAQVTADAREEATGGESKSEGKYDTRATEASYLAAGQGERLAGLRAFTAWLDGLDAEIAMSAVGPGALVGLERDGVPGWVLLAPQGGHRLHVDGVLIVVVSTDSPLGAALEGLGVGDAEEVDSPRGVLQVEIVAVA